jgi:endoglucanase
MVLARALVLSFALLAAFAASSCAKDPDTRLAMEDGKTVVERYGQLKVIGPNLCDQSGKPVQLRGMSSHALHWHGKYANKEVLKWLRDDWNCQLWRAAMYLTEGGYITGPAVKQKVVDSIEAAVENGMYVLVDWHVHRDRDPNVYKAQALEFFRDIAQRYGQYPNVLYEICNEPNGAEVTWSDHIKPYALEVIAEIRKYDPDGIIIVGTPNYSQELDKAAADPIEGYDNIMYTLHFYAGSHGQELMAKAKTAYDAGLAVFATEWGTTLNTGDQFHPDKVMPWLSFLKKHNISWANWSVNNKGEDSGILVYNADRTGKGGWKDEDLSPSGKFLRKILRNELKVK